MKKSIVTLLVGLGLGALGTSDAAQSAGVRVFGAFSSHRTEETYDISVGASSSGGLSSAKNHRERRETVAVPAHYGEVIGVTAAQGIAIAWYRSADGTVRNVILSEPGANLYRLESSPTARLEVRRMR